MPATASLPQSEPLSARAGDTWRWDRSLPLYPAPTWTLTYTLCGTASMIRITATGDGTLHQVHVHPTITGTYAAGRYDWVAHVADGTDRYQVGRGAIDVLPDVRTATALDGRSHARRVLDAIEAAIEGRAADGDLDLVRTQLGDQQVERDPAALAAAHRQYAAMVAAEERAAAAARGQRTGVVQVQFR